MVRQWRQLLKDAEESILLEMFEVIFNTLLYLMGNVKSQPLPMWELTANNVISFQIPRMETVKYR